jgi:FdhD protein
MRKVEILKIDVSTHKVQQMEDYVAEEKPLFIFLNKTHYVTILCSPSDLKDLVVGHLLSQSIIKTTKEIEKLGLKEETCHVKLVGTVDLTKRLKLSGMSPRVIYSVCGSPSPHLYSGKTPKVKSDLKVEAQTIQKCVARLNSLAETFRKTGGVHVAAVYGSDGKLVASAEDVGRHNAVDKAVGKAALAEARLYECFLALSGRMTDDIVRKAARVAIPVVASLAAAVDSGIRTAQETGLTLVGFVRGHRMNVYTFPERILA